MNKQSKPNHHILHRSLVNVKSQMFLNKFPINSSKKLRTQSIEAKGNQNILRQKNSQHKLTLDLAERQMLKKNRILKPLKSTYKEQLAKVYIQNFQNITIDQQINELYPNLFIKRTGSTAPTGIRQRSQTNRQNILNEQQKHQVRLEGKDNIESISSIFHYNSKQKLAKLSNLIKYTNKPHLIFCSSKLPKDFFGEGVQTSTKHQKKFIMLNRNQQQKSHKKLKYTASDKALGKFQKLNFQDPKPQNKPQFRIQPAFTFRKGQSKKQLQKNQQNYVSTPNFQRKSISSIVHYSSIDYLDGNQKISLEPIRKLRRNSSKKILKL